MTPPHNVEVENTDVEVENTDILSELPQVSQDSGKSFWRRLDYLFRPYAVLSISENIKHRRQKHEELSKTHAGIVVAFFQGITQIWTVSAKTEPIGQTRAAFTDPYTQLTLSKQ